MWLIILLVLMKLYSDFLRRRRTTNDRAIALSVTTATAKYTRVPVRFDSDVKYDGCCVDWTKVTMPDASWPAIRANKQQARALFPSLTWRQYRSIRGDVRDQRTYTSKRDRRIKAGPGEQREQKWPRCPLSGWNANIRDPVDLRRYYYLKKMPSAWTFPISFTK